MKKVLLLLLILLSVVSLSSCSHKNPAAKDASNFGSPLDESIQGGVDIGPLDLSNTNEVKAALQKKVDASYMNYKINVNPQVINKKANLMIENAKSNPYLVQVEIIDAKTNNPMYKSSVMKPGTSIKEAKMDYPAGDYNAVAIFRCYDMNTKTQVGEAGVNIKINIK